MGQRIDLHQILVNALGSNNVYFQPPETIKMKYPCIVYILDGIESEHAGNRPYLHRRKYSVTVIDKDPESEIPGRVSDLQYSRYDRHFVSDNLHHDVFTLYY